MRIAPLRVANVSAAGSRNNSPRAQEIPSSRVRDMACAGRDLLKPDVNNDYKRM